MTLWPGTCIVHEQFSEREIVKLKARHPDAKLAAHPECPEPILNHADHVFARDHAEDLSRFGPEDRERIQRMMDQLLESVLHDPSSRLLKEKELREKLRDIELFRDLFGLRKDRP